MNVGNFTQIGAKGQIVIPAEIRKAMGVAPNDPVNITLAGNGAYIQPVAFYPKNLATDDAVFLEFLKRYRGIWGPETTEEKRRRMAGKRREIKRARQMSRTW